MKFGPVDTKKMIVTDFETFYDDEYHLLRNGKGQRTEEYILDKRFQAHGVAVSYPNGKTEWVEGKDIARWIKAYRTYTLCNHKLTFDGLIWKFRYNHVAPLMVDTLFLANAVCGPAEVSGGNDLDSVAERLGLPAKGKNLIEFKGKRTEDLSPAERKSLAAYAENDADITRQAAMILLPQISRPEFELWLLDHTLRVYITKPLPVDASKCKSAMKIVTANVSSKIKAMPKITFKNTTQVGSGKNKKILIAPKVVDEEVLASNKQFGQALLQVLDKAKVRIPKKMGKNGLIPALAKNDEGFMALKNHENKTVSALVTARLAKRSADTQLARLRGLLLCAANGGFHVFLNYWGAGTGRWSGGSGLNAHNFPNPMRSPDEFEREVAGLIRACVGPGKGRKFTAVDAANIEARVLAWWARQQDLVEAFGSGNDVYSSFASDAFGEEVRKPKADDPKDKAVRFKLLRNVGKATVLGLGYSMGAPKFEKNLRASPDVSALFKNGELDTAKCEGLVKTYRHKYTEIVSLWSKVENAFFKARDGAARMVNGVLFSKGAKRGVDVTLPSGRTIHYPNVRVGEATDNGRGGKRVQWVYGHGKGKKLYGGLLVENIVQAISRDILAEGVWAMEAEGFPVAYHVHDSIVCSVADKQAKHAMEYCIECLSQAPVWGEGMMLGAEGAIEEVFA